MLKINIVVNKKKEGNEFLLKDAYKAILNRIFYFKITFHGFKHKEIFYSRDISSQENIWSLKKFNKVKIPDKEEFDFQIEEIGKERIDFIEALEKFLPDAIFEEKNEITLKDIEDNYKQYFEKYIPTNTNLLIYILDTYFNTSPVNLKSKLGKDNNIYFYEKDLSKNNKKFIKEFNSFETIVEQIEYIKTHLTKKYNPKKETDLKEIIKKCLNYKDVNTLKKINNFFTKVSIPGKYIVRHNELLLENWFNLSPKEYESF